MGLGGITRDSIADLASLVHDDDGANSGLSKLSQRQRSFDDRRVGYIGVIDAVGVGGSNEEGDGEYLILEEPSCVGLNDHAADELVEEPQKSLATSTSASNNNNNGEANETQVPTAQLQGMYYGFQYEGYTDYYAEDFSPYGYDADTNKMQPHQQKKNLFCCLFAPWMGNNDKLQSEPNTLGGQMENVRAHAFAAPQGGEPKDKVQLGQALREQAASPSVAAGIASPVLPPTVPADNALPQLGTSDPVLQKDSTGIPSRESTPKSPKLSTPSKCAGKESPSISTQTKSQDGSSCDKSYNSTPSVKSILKIKHCTNRATNNNTSNSQQVTKNKKDPSDTKRHLFPTYEPKNVMGSPRAGEKTAAGKDNKIGFNPMARVLTIPSRKDIPLSQKAQVWWQKSDYDDFKKTGRIISKAMECGGSEIWLTSTNAWGKGQQSRDSATKSKRQDENEKLVGAEAEVDTDAEYVKALEKYTGGSNKGSASSDSTDSNSNNFGNKWWCKFGHSRRGLEHIVSSSEGKARQQSVLLAIEMILEEQKRQRVARTRDPNKLRNVAMQYTSWARDLALAAGAADHEAVESNFCSAAKSRAHHFAKRSTHLLNESGVAGGGVAVAITSQILDENTHGRRSSMPTQTPQLPHSDHDVSDASLSKRAKGFIPGESVDVSASQIMSGMGNMKVRAAVKA